MRNLFLLSILLSATHCWAAPSKPAPKKVSKAGPKKAGKPKASKPAPKQPGKLTPAQEKVAEATFNAGIALMEKEKFKEALVELQKVLKLDPMNPNVLWNAGLSAQLSGNPKLAVAYFERNFKLEPRNGLLLGKLVQSYEALGDTKNRDLWRKQLFAMHKSGNDESGYSKNDRYMREQFKVNGESVFVFEFFELKPRSQAKDATTFGRRYEFLVFPAEAGDEDEPKMRLEVGWNFLESDGKGGYKPGTELTSFYLDAYYPGQEPHRKTFGLFQEELPYDIVKKYFMAIVEGKMEPTASGSR